MIILVRRCSTPLRPWNYAFYVTKYKLSYTKGRCLGPLSKAFPLDPTRGHIGTAGVDPTRGFLRFALDVSPPKQFLKDGSPGPRTENGCCHWYICKLQSVMHSMEKDSSTYLFDRRNQPGVIWPYGPLRLLSGPLNSRKLLLLVFMWTPTCNSFNMFNAKRFVHISLRLNESVRWHGPLGLLSGPLYRRKLLLLVFMWTLRCNSFNAKRLIHKSLRLNKSFGDIMALWGYCLGASTGESCCHWCFCELQHVIVSMQKDSFMNLFG